MRFSHAVWYTRVYDTLTRRLLFLWQVTNELMSHAADDAVFMHCLPRHKEEVDDEVKKDFLYRIFSENLHYIIPGTSKGTMRWETCTH